MSRPAVAAAAGLIAFGLGFGLASAAPVSAHTASTFYWAGWHNDHTENYFFRDNVPGGNFRDRVEDGFLQWNNTPNDGNAEPNFNRNGEKSDNNGDWNQPCNSGYSAVYYRDLSSLGAGTIGYTPFCTVSEGPPPSAIYYITKFSMSLDNGMPWYSGTGDAPSNDVDTWSIASHEAGHATGWYGHFAENGDLCPNDSTRRTMCPLYYPGTERQRTLEDHDYHTFENAYPWP